MNQKSLLIVESPTKVKTIQQYLGKEYDVISCVGHVKDLPKNDLGIDLENDFKIIQLSSVIKFEYSDKAKSLGYFPIISAGFQSGITPKAVVSPARS